MKKILLIAALPLLLTGCTSPSLFRDTDSPAVTSYVQGNPFPPSETLAVTGETPLNFRNQVGVWLPYMHFEDYMSGKTADEFRQAVHSMLDDYKAQDVNTVYFHAHPCGDAYYDSDIFPKGVYLDGDYDPLDIVTEEAHSLGISLHAWINPLRCQTQEQMDSLPDDFIIKKWLYDPECSCVKLVGSRYYLDPAYTEVTELVCRCAEEILEKYPVDGIHIDDYFYPSTDPEFDRTEFERSGSADLSLWRQKNCTRLVKSLCDTVKIHGDGFVFGISPQGNISADYETQYADVRLWSGSKDYCDYIVPQIYFGFKNAACPFEATLKQWEELTCGSEVSLIIGLAAYKTGKEDKWAGVAGQDEWINDPDIISRQTELVKQSSADGYALYY
ncbi:MAG: family 10 glycosylhydrolase [Ruminococcus sp.]|nr:family 10 glycosylhydrolase [Ruminococcus sp.]